MSSYMAPYNSTGTADIDPLTGLPKKKKKTAAGGLTPTALYNQSDIDASLAANPQGTFGPSSGVGYSMGAKSPGMPDYKKLIADALGPMTAQFGADDAADLGTRNQQLIRALGQFGEQFNLGSANQAFGEDFVGQAGLGELLPQANQLAQQTTDAGMSFTARSTKAHKDSVRAIKNSLAKRGLLRSGETGHQLQEAQTAFDTGQYDARQQVQDFMGAVNQGYAEAVRSRKTQLGSATREEAERQARMNPGVANPAGGSFPTAVYGPGVTEPVLPPALPASSPNITGASPLPNILSPNFTDASLSQVKAAAEFNAARPAGSILAKQETPAERALRLRSEALNAALIRR